MLTNSWGWLTCFELAIQLLELKAFVAVAVALGVAKVITGGGPAVLFGGLFRSRLAPVGSGAYALAEVLALHAEFLAAAGQDVLAGGSGTLGPGGVLCGSRHISALARSLRGKRRENGGLHLSGRAPCDLIGQCGCQRALWGEEHLPDRGNGVARAAKEQELLTTLPMPRKQTWPQRGRRNPQSSQRPVNAGSAHC